MEGASLSAEEGERGGLAVANEMVLDVFSCFAVSLKKSEIGEGGKERERERST